MEPAALRKFFKDEGAAIVGAAISAAAKLALHATGQTVLARGEVDRLRAQLKALLEVLDASLP